MISTSVKASRLSLSAFSSYFNFYWILGWI